MAPVRSQQKEKRVQQACRNCRRKKIRCPGERPACSTCFRLRQYCEYSIASGLKIVHHGIGGAKNLGSFNFEEANLAELEEAIRPVFADRRLSESECVETAFSDRQSGTGRASSETSIICHKSIDMPDQSTIVRALDLYFLHCHRQPIWLFEGRDSLTPETCCEELLFPILALASCHDRSLLQNNSRLNFKTCCSSARALVFKRLFNGTVLLSTLQSLCLLSFVSFVETNLYLCRYYLDTAQTLIRGSGIDNVQATDTKPAFEERRRLFWSVFYLQQLCGSPAQYPTLYDIENPAYVALITRQRGSNIPCLSFPNEAYSEFETPKPGIWAHLIRMGSVWTDLRNYMVRCANGDVEPPWLPDSEHNLINARLLDFETTFLEFYRYSNARFSERSSEEINIKRQYWLPWMSIQLTYHTLQAILNHPFLRAVTKSASRFGHNVFWKLSAEKALLHGNWIARIIEMCNEQKLHTADPFLAHFAAVAASIHIYHSRSKNERVRAAASANLSTCRKFVAELATYWPVSRAIDETLTQLIAMSRTTASKSQDRLGGIALNTALMWKILDFTSLALSSSDQKHSLFDTSFFLHPTIEGTHSDDTNVEQIDTPLPIMSPNPAEDFSTPVDWFDAVTSPNCGRADTLLGTIPGSQTIQARRDQSLLEPDWSLGATTILPDENETLVDMSEYPSMHFYRQDDTVPGWWDFGNL